ncbi:MAG: hypothetical protein PUP91_36910, partial [Rhizonema sp. PD37]|nr:hypothetical protein [Rhizonema sp. PD37]
GEAGGVNCIKIFVKWYKARTFPTDVTPICPCGIFAANCSTSQYYAQYLLNDYVHHEQLMLRLVFFLQSQVLVSPQIAYQLS